MREELGDILLQVYFHSRIAQEHPTDPFSIEEVAEGIADKLIRRHPHVFGNEAVESSADVLANWEKLKAAEKNRNSATDGVALSQPALPLITKLIYRAEKNGIDLDLPTTDMNNDVPADIAIGDALVAAVVAAIKHGIEPEDLLRSRAREISAEIKRIESL
jgi:XTP/dITP diphosphohydrolase